MVLTRNILFRYYILIFIAAIAINSFIIASNDEKLCKDRITIYSSDKEWLENFIKEFFLSDNMLYTLFGTKPMSVKPMWVMSKNECLQHYQTFIAKLNNDEQKEALNIIDNLCKPHIVTNYIDRWLSLQKSNDNIKAFLFRSSLSADKRFRYVYMINVRETLWLLQKCYAVFSKELGMDFKPLQVALEFEDPNSAFGNNALRSDYLLGLLYGFGERNAYFFSLFAQDLENNSIIDNHHPIFAGDSSEVIDSVQNVLTVADIGLPKFRSFDVPLIKDPIVSQYEVERELIIKLLSEKDFTIEVLKKIFNKDIIIE